MANTSFVSTSAMNHTTFNNAFNDFPLITAGNSTNADANRLFTFSLYMRSTGAIKYKLDFRNGQAGTVNIYYQRFGGGSGAWPSTNINSWTTGSTGAWKPNGTGEYLLYWDRFVGSGGVVGLLPETGIVSADMTVTNGGVIQVNTRAASGARAAVSSTGGIRIDGFMIGRMV